MLKIFLVIVWNLIYSLYFYICNNAKQHQNPKIMIASELKIGDTFKSDGFLLTVAKITPDTYKNGTPCLMVECTTNGGKIIDSFKCLKLTTKVK